MVLLAINKMIKITRNCNRLFHYYLYQQNQPPSIRSSIGSYLTWRAIRIWWVTLTFDKSNSPAIMFFISVLLNFPFMLAKFIFWVCILVNLNCFFILILIFFCNDHQMPSWTNGWVAFIIWSSKNYFHFYVVIMFQ